LVGFPEITPVFLLMETPGGSPLAEKVLAPKLVVTAYLAINFRKLICCLARLLVMSAARVSTVTLPVIASPIAAWRTQGHDKANANMIRRRIEFMILKKLMLVVMNLFFLYRLLHTG
jgi:hypothetical protein